MTTFSGRSTAIRRGAVLLRSSRIEASNIADVDEAVGAGDADPLDEVAERFRRHAAPANAGKGRHARIVPAGDMAVADQLGEHALGEDRVGEIEPRELVLAWPRRHRQVLDEPVIERPVILEFERAERMGDALDRVRLAVGEVVARIDVPFGAGARVAGVEDAVEHRVAEIDVAGRHVDLGAEHARAVRELAGAHAARRGRDSPRRSARGYGLLVPGSVSVPRVARISSCDWSST